MLDRHSIARDCPPSAARPAQRDSNRGSPALRVRESGRPRSAAASAAADTLDNPYFPSRGIRAQLDWTDGLKSLGDSSDFQTVQLNGAYAKGWGRHAVVLNLAGGDTYQGVLPITSLFTLGGRCGSGPGA